MNNVLRTLLWNDQVSLTIADTTELVCEGIRLHGLKKLSAITFGRALSAMTFMSACLKAEKGEISLSAKGDGLGGEVAVSGNKKLCLRGYIENTEVVEGTENDCFGKEGSITIIRNDGYSRPFVGSCAYTGSGDIDESIEEYFRISEQLPTKIATAVKTDEKGACVFAGVIALQPLPFADKNILEKVESTDLYALLNGWTEETVEQMASKAFADTSDSVWELKKAVYRCNCSREYLLEVLTSLGEAQMRQIIKEDGAVRVHCHYCNTDYEFIETDADALFKKD
ncbi:MAG: Hsp33 family molecular chaperone HslO [Clostridia bacterium]|nr:Hsp33 family molecular chaperone HslO [Clostridia bacterium]